MKRHAIHLSLLVLALTTTGCYARLAIRPLPPPQPIAWQGPAAPPASADLPAAQRAVAALIEDCISRPWAQRFVGEQGRLPVVRVHPLRNHAVHVASALAYTHEVERALVSSGRALVAGSFVAGGSAHAAAQAELADQREHASDATMKSPRPLAADFVLSGWVVTERDERSAHPVQVVTLQLIAVESNEKVWMSSRRI